MQNLSETTQELMLRLKGALAGTVSFEEFKPKTPEEKAQSDADALNMELGKEHELDGYVCEKCRNRGYMYYANGIYVTRSNCECWKARQSIRRMQRSGLGNVINKYTFALYNAETEWQKQIKETAKAFVHDDHAKWFFIGGASGAGKSHICTAICRNLLATKEVHYMMWEEESVELKSMVTDAETYYPRMNRLKEVDVLYIDDFFSGRKERNGELAKPTFADVRLAREILNHRYVNQKITIISSEWHSMEILELDEALGGRVVEMSGKYCLNVGRGADKNYRLKMGGAML